MSAIRILSGMRPTGRMHLGNYVGALENWVKLQHENESFHMVADWHMLTTGYEDIGKLKQDTMDMVTDWLAAGLDPKATPIFRQSRIKEHAELHLLFSMLVTKARLERNPSLKEQARDLHIEEQTITYGHLGYPVLQAADILIYKANLVPVGEDQVPHVELTREIARRFNYLYCPDKPVFPEPEARLTAFPRLRGLDGNRMSKSVGNTIHLTDSEDEIRTKMRSAYTDPEKVRADSPGHPEGCVVHEYHRVFNPGGAEAVATLCRAGQLGCAKDKGDLTKILADALAPIRERYHEIQSKPGYVEDVLQDGEARARKVAQATMDEVREAMNLP